MSDVNLSKISGKEFIEDHLTLENVDILLRKAIQELPPEKRKENYERIANKLSLPIDDILERVCKITLEDNSWVQPSEILDIATMDIDTFLVKKYEPRPFYLSPWLQPGTLAEIYGPTGIGKSYLSYAIALAVTHGVNISPWVAENTAGVLIFDGEMPCQSIQQRLKMLSDGLPKRKTPISIISSNDLQSQNYVSPNFTKAEWRDALTEYLKKHPEFRILILDNVVSLFPGLDENSAKEWSPSNQWMLRIRSLNVALIKINHSTKVGKTSRGTGLQNDNMDTVIKLQRPKVYHTKQGARFEVRFEKGRELSGGQAEPFIFQIVSDQSNPDKLTWKTEKLIRQESSSEQPTENVKTIIAELANGMKQKDIAKKICCSPQHVSKTKKKAIEDGILDSEDRLTDKGRKIYCKDQDEDNDNDEDAW